MSITELNQRSQHIFGYIVENYLRSGQPVGSKQVLSDLSLDVSSATIRNVMASLEGQGLLFAPHTSAGRIPTQTGLRFYLDGLMQIGEIDQSDKAEIDALCMDAGETTLTMLDKASQKLSGLSQQMGLVLAPKQDKPIKQIQFMKISDYQALAVIVLQDGLVENRLVALEKNVPASELERLSNFLNSICVDHTIQELSSVIDRSIEQSEKDLALLTDMLVKKGVAVETLDVNEHQHLIIKGQSRLLEDLQAVEDIDRARDLFSLLEDQQRMMALVNSANEGEGVKVYLGAENDVFNQAGWTMMISPYKNAENNIIGALGVIGPTRLNYGRIIPILDYTSRVLTKMIG